jgi:hypothetical protein
MCFLDSSLIELLINSELLHYFLSFSENINSKNFSKVSVKPICYDETVMGFHPVLSG